MNSSLRKQSKNDSNSRKQEAIRKNRTTIVAITLAVLLMLLPVSSMNFAMPPLFVPINHKALAQEQGEIAGEEQEGSISDNDPQELEAVAASSSEPETQKEVTLETNGKEVENDQSSSLSAMVDDVETTMNSKSTNEMSAAAAVASKGEGGYDWKGKYVSDYTIDGPAYHSKGHDEIELSFDASEECSSSDECNITGIGTLSGNYHAEWRQGEWTCGPLDFSRSDVPIDISGKYHPSSNTAYLVFSRVSDSQSVTCVHTTGERGTTTHTRSLPLLDQTDSITLQEGESISGTYDTIALDEDGETVGTGTGTYQLGITEGPTGDFSIECPTNVSEVTRGSSVDVNCTITSLERFNKQVDLTCQPPSDEPTITCGINPTSVTPSADGDVPFTLKISTTNDTPLSEGYVLDVTGISGDLEHTVSVTCAVVGCDPDGPSTAKTNTQISTKTAAENTEAGACCDPNLCNTATKYIPKRPKLIYYTVSGDTLKEIGEKFKFTDANGKKFAGYTERETNYYLHRGAEGKVDCKYSRFVVEITVYLPKLSPLSFRSLSVDAQNEWKTFEKLLKSHEYEHVAIVHKFYDGILKKVACKSTSVAEAEIAKVDQKYNAAQKEHDRKTHGKVVLDPNIE